MKIKENTVKTSRILTRLLDRRKKIDYLFAFIIGAWPAGLAYLIGAHNINDSDYLGYWDSPNWWSLALLLPAILYALRWAMGKIVPVIEPATPQDAPPIIDVLPNVPAKNQLYADLRQCILSKNNLYLALIVAILVTVTDSWNVYLPYFTDKPPAANDWSSLYLLEGSISKKTNLALLVFAYLAQFTATFIGMLAIILIFRHNRFFMRHIYQRRWMHEGENKHFFQIDVNDINRCFGFRPTNEAFNTQVKALMIAGVAMFLSRYAHTRDSEGTILDSLTWPPVMPEFSFPAPGQWLMAVSWIIALIIVAMPSSVKLLPWLPSRGSKRIHLCVENYLQEFFSKETWPKNKNGEDESVEQVARKFARNSFWPTGDNRARTLFLFSYWIFFVILLPPASFDIVTLLITFTVFGIAAYLTMLATFTALKWALRYIDDMLVVDQHQKVDETQETDEESSPRKSELGVFISYRRRETAPYARSILESLQEHFHREHLFMDIDNIEPGVKFGQEIEKALDRVDAVIALIGREWSTISDDDGSPRIHNPKDMVRYEIATALKQQKRIFPVLVGGAAMPSEDVLPDPLKELSQFNAVELSDSRWEYDMGLLVNTLKEIK